MGGAAVVGAKKENNITIARINYFPIFLFLLTGLDERSQSFIWCTVRENKQT